MTEGHISAIPTPALVVDVAGLERNIARMAAFFSEGQCRLRPHFKAHKTPEIARRQLAVGGAVGLTCATVSEAEVVAAFCRDILLANEIVTPDKCGRVARLAGGVAMTVAVDSVAGVDALSAAAASAGTQVGVLVDVNVGQHRCGVSAPNEAVALARRVSTSPGLALRGVMGYEGHVQPIADRVERVARAQDAMTALVATAEALRAAGLSCEIVSGGGTGTYDISGRVAGVTEIQAGSYALMDTDYGRLDLPFEPALFLLGTVVSRPVPTRVVADCGHKSCSKDHGHPQVVGVAGANVLGLNDEHVTIDVPASSPLRVGDRIRLRPSHVDPTINLHDALYAVEGEHVVGRWPVAARGYAEERS